MFGYNATRSTEFYPLSLHDALPICEDLQPDDVLVRLAGTLGGGTAGVVADHPAQCAVAVSGRPGAEFQTVRLDRKSTRLNSSHVAISYAVFCLKKKKPRACC